MKFSSPVLSVRDLHKSYGSFEAVKGIDFDTHPAETFALLGPNGAGKSTAIKILEGYRDRSSTLRRGISSGTWCAGSRRKAEGTTILLTTHCLDKAAQLGERAGVINNGRLIDIGPIDEIGGAEARVPLVRRRDAQGAVKEIGTDRPGQVVAELVGATGGEPVDLEVIRPSLEAVYLALSRGTTVAIRGGEDAAEEADHRDTADDEAAVGETSADETTITEVRS